MRFVAIFLLLGSCLFAETDEEVHSDELLETCKKIEEHPHFRMVRNILSTNSLGNVSRNWDNIRNLDFTFSHEVEPMLPATNQKWTGRCWMYAALNELRIPICKELSLPNFEFSQSYLFFFDKIEKANYFLEKVIDVTSGNKGTELLRFFTTNPMFDGNFWQSFYSLVKKYGLVPKSVYPENAACFYSGSLNRVLSMKLLQGADKIRALLDAGGSLEEARAIKKETMKDVYKIMVVHMGTPPTEFTWSYYDNERKYHIHKNLTPHGFYEQFVEADLDEYVILVDSPRTSTPYYKRYAIKYSNTVVGGEQYTGLNIPIDRIKEIARAVIVNDKAPVLFACDVFTVDSATGIMDPDMFEFEALYQVDFSMTKAAKVQYNLWQPNHQMLFTGVNIHDGATTKWKVENSWGDEAGINGYYVLTDSWFDEYVFEVIVPRKNVPEDLQAYIDEPAKIVEPWEFWEGGNSTSAEPYVRG